MRQLDQQKFCGWCGGMVTYPSKWQSVCSTCGYKQYQNPLPCSSALIICGDEVLILQRSIEPGKGKFDLPGGFMDMTDKSIEAAAYRELHEELGIKQRMITQVTYFGSGIQPYEWQGTELLTAPCYFTCHITTKDRARLVVDPKEGSQVRWVSRADVPTVDFAFDLDKEMLTSYFSNKTP